MARKPLTKTQKINRLSPNAKALLERIKEGRFYKAHDGKTPKAMQELIDLGLVDTMMRVQTIVACYVPKGAVPHQPEVLVPVAKGAYERRLKQRYIALKHAANDMIDALDDCSSFEIEAGAFGQGPLYELCLALGRPLPENFKLWLQDNGN